MKKLLLTILTFFILAGVALADSYVLVRAAGPQEPDQTIAYIVDIFGRDVLGDDMSGKYVQYQITDFDDYQAIKNYLQPWQKQIEWDFLGHNYTLDGHRLKVWMTNMSASGLNNLTRGQVESFLSRWNAEVNDELTVNNNEVVFDAIVYDAIQSEGFWDGVDISDVEFYEVSYNQTTGVHRIRVDISATSYTPAQAEFQIEQRGGQELLTIGDRVWFSIARDTVFNEFKLSVKEALETQTFSGKLYRIPEAYLPTAEDGYKKQITKNQFVTFIRSRLDD